MNVLLLDTKRKILPVYEYCKKVGYNVKVLYVESWPPSESEILVSQAVEYEDKIFYDFIPDQIVNFKEQEKYLKLETSLNERFGLEGDYSNPLLGLLGPSRRPRSRVAWSQRSAWPRVVGHDVPRHPLLDAPRRCIGRRGDPHHVGDLRLEEVAQRRDQRNRPAPQLRARRLPRRLRVHGVDLQRRHHG